MKQFIEHIQKSIYSPEYYRDLFAKPFSFSWKYYTTLALLISLLLTIVTSVPLIPKLNSALRDLPGAVLAYYPDDLVVTANKGMISSNKEEPLYLPLPPIIRDELGYEKIFGHLVAIDTGTPFSFEQFETHNALLWVGGDFVAYYEDENKIATQRLDEGVTFVLSEQSLGSLLQMLVPYFKFVAPILVLLFFFGFIMLFAVNLLYLFFGALLILLLGKLLKEGWGYRKAYQIGMHAMTLPIFLNGVFFVFGMGLSQIPFLFTIIMLLVVYSNFARSSAQASAKHEEAIPPASPLPPAV